jgi:signal peptidase II
MIWAIIVAVIIGLDQLVKFFIVQNIEMYGQVPVISGFFYLTYIRNSGAAWSMLQNGRIFFLIMIPLVAAVLVYFLRKSEHRLLRLALSFILGGAVGNYIDRVAAGSVVDFLQFHFGSYIFPNFNVADTFVVVGTFILAYYLLFIYKEKEKEPEKETQDGINNTDL